MRKIILPLLVLVTITSISSGQELHHLSKPEVDIGLIIDNEASDPKISSNGRFISFISKASNLVANDSNNSDDVFIKDRNTGITQLVSVTASGVQPDRDSYLSKISSPSSDGRYIAFVTDAVSLPNANGIDLYLYVKDMQTGSLVNASSYDNGNAYFSVSLSDIYLSDDGQVIIFTTASHIDPLHTSNQSQVYRKDLSNMTFELLSLSSDGLTAANSSTDLAHVSYSGRFVLLNSRADNLTTDVLNNTGENLFIRDLQMNTTTLVNITPAGISSNDSDTNIKEAEISNNGQVVFVSQQADLVSNDNNNRDDVFYYDNGTIIRLNLDANGNELLIDSNSNYVAISGNGSRIAFTEYSDELFPASTNQSYDLYTYETNNGDMSLISQTPSGNKANNHSYKPQLSATGDRLIFSSIATDMTADIETGLFENLFYYNFNTNMMKNESVAAFAPNTLLSDARYARTSSNQMLVVYGTNSPNILSEPIDDKTFDLFLLDRNSNTHSKIAGNISTIYPIDISASGNYISFRTNNLPPDGITPLGDYFIYLFDRVNNIYTQIAPGNYSAVNNDGVVVFMSYDSLDINDTNSSQDVYVFNPISQNVTLVSRDMSGFASSAKAMDIGGSGNNTSVVFSSDSSEIVADDVNASDDIFVKNVTNNSPITRITKTVGGIEANNGSYNPVLSEDAKWIAFETDASNLTNDNYSLAYHLQVLVFDRIAQSFSLISKNHQGIPVTDPLTANVSGVSISDTGKYVSYVYKDAAFPGDGGGNKNFKPAGEKGTVFPNFAGDIDLQSDVILFDMDTQNARLISKHLNGTHSEDNVDLETHVVEDVSISPSKVGVIFMAEGGDLTELANHPGHQEVFLYQAQEQSFDLIFQNSFE